MGAVLIDREDRAARGETMAAGNGEVVDGDDRHDARDKEDPSMLHVIPSVSEGPGRAA